MATKNKYDRQLRLWGASGQQALAETTVVLLQATAAGTETCKNLVLPGVGRVLIVDDLEAKVTDSECRSNFFLTATLGGTRGSVAAQLLQELNPDVVVESYDLPLSEVPHSKAERQSLQDLLEVQAGKGHVLVVASDLDPPLADVVSQICGSVRNHGDQNALPLIHVQCYGLLGVVRLQVDHLLLLEPKPRDAPPDLRLVRPFSALQQLADEIDLDQLDNQQHGYVPYPIILLKASALWKASHDGQLPSNFSDKQAFAQSVKNMARDYNDELNFQEAYSNAYLAYTSRPLGLPSHSVEGKAAQLFAALATFAQRHDGQAPLQGIIPDMTSSTDLYIRLQKAYQEQAQQDLKEMQALAACVDEVNVRRACQYAHHLDVLSTRTMTDESHAPLPPDLAEDLRLSTMEGDERPDQLPLLWYLGLAACHLFYQDHGRYPGTVDDYAKDVSLVSQQYVPHAVAHYGMQENELVQSTLLGSSDYAHELVRYANAEIHNIASIVGGVASQEAVKLITGQYVPLNNTFVFNGIASIGGVYKF